MKKITITLALTLVLAFVGCENVSIRPDEMNISIVGSWQPVRLIIEENDGTIIWSDDLNECETRSREIFNGHGHVLRKIYDPACAYTESNWQYIVSETTLNMYNTTGSADETWSIEIKEDELTLKVPYGIDGLGWQIIYYKRIN